MAITFNLNSIRSEFPILDTKVQNGSQLHYLDNAATSQMPLSVIESIQNFDQCFRANIKRGVHYLAEEATESYQNARKTISNYVNASSEREIVFTSGTTASINLLANSLASQLSENDEIILSILEHHSNIVPWQIIRERTGIIIKTLPATTDGLVDVNKLNEIISPKSKLISVTHASNVTGGITNLKEIVNIAKQYDTLVAIDGAQSAPHGPFDVQSLDVDFYSFSGHKMYGPTGIGILWGRSNLLETLPPFLGGGEMIKNVSFENTTYADYPARFEAGTPPITQAVGLARAAQWITENDYISGQNHLNQLTSTLIEGLESLESKQKKIYIIGPDKSKYRMPVVSFSITNTHPHDICQILDSHGVALRGGHHCAQPYMDSLKINGTTRASLAIYNNIDDINALLNGLEDALARLSYD